MFHAVVTVWHVAFTVFNGAQGIILGILAFYEKYHKQAWTLKNTIVENHTAGITLRNALLKDVKACFQLFSGAEDKNEKNANGVVNVSDSETRYLRIVFA